MYILNFEINQYEQEGFYFVAAWTHKPDHNQLIRAMSHKLPFSDNPPNLYSDDFTNFDIRILLQMGKIHVSHYYTFYLDYVENGQVLHKFVD